MRKKHKAENSLYDSNLEENFHELWKKHSTYQMTHHHVVELSRKWELDFAFPNHKIGIELQGYGTGHVSYLGMKRDYEKHNDFVSAGWLILYFMSNHLLTPGYPISLIKQSLEKKNVRITEFNTHKEERCNNKPNNLIDAARRLQNQRFNPQNLPRKP
jgi:very-short-patch-repair endonuclease